MNTAHILKTIRFQNIFASEDTHRQEEVNYQAMFFGQFFFFCVHFKFADGDKQRTMLLAHLSRGQK